MAIQQSQALPPQYVEDLQKDYGKQLTATTAAPLDTSKFAPTVAGQDPFQTQAYNLTGSGIGAYQPYLTQAGAYTGPGSQAAFMSPYQQDVIDTTMTEYDTQAQKGMSGIGQLAAQSGNLGGGREGVMRGEYQNKSDLNRALLMAGLQQQGFGQAQKGAQQAYMNQMQMGQGIQQFQGADIAGLGSMGATQQAQEQAQLDAVREQNRLAAYEPYERLGYQGQGIASIASGMPGQYQSTVQPNPTPLQTALGTGSVLSGIYGNMMGPYRTQTN
jgi:Arc/MetJ-type ribon-helix-helix transcriptional regulator